MLKKIIKFIKYNTMITAMIAVGFIAVASVMAANEDVKKVIGEEIVEKTGVDNSVLLATNLEDFDLEMKITNVMEDAENYYIDYEFNTLGIQDNVWQEIFNQSQLVVSIEALEGGDLGLYVTEELGEVIDYQLAYLKEVQENEEEKGKTLVVETTKYTGLIGLILDTKTKELPGYEPVVKPVVSDDAPDDEIPPAPFVKGGDEDTPFDDGDDDYVEDSYYYEFLINNCLSNGGYWYNNTCNAEPEPVISVCDADNLDLCTTQDLCEGVSLYWYDDVCNETPDDEIPPAPFVKGGDDEDPVCDADNLDLCISQELCGGINLYWYGDACNVEEEIVTPAFTCDADHPTLCGAQDICENMGLYWYEGECHLEEEIVDDEVPVSVGD